MTTLCEMFCCFASIQTVAIRVYVAIVDCPWQLVSFSHIFLFFSKLYDAWIKFHKCICKYRNCLIVKILFMQINKYGQKGVYREDIWRFILLLKVLQSWFFLETKRFRKFSFICLQIWNWRKIECQTVILFYFSHFFAFRFLFWWNKHFQSLKPSAHLLTWSLTATVQLVASANKCSFISSLWTARQQ